jgi:hypothetical protein
MQPCLYLRASDWGSAIPVAQIRHMHDANANAPTSSYFSPVTLPQPSWILVLTHPRLVTHISALDTHSFRKIRISQTNIASSPSTQSRCPSPRQVILPCAFPRTLLSWTLTSHLASKSHSARAFPFGFPILTI